MAGAPSSNSPRPSVPIHPGLSFQFGWMVNPFLEFSLLPQLEELSSKRKRLERARHPDQVAYEKHLEAAEQAERDVAFHRKKAEERRAAHERDDRGWYPDHERQIRETDEEAAALQGAYATLMETGQGCERLLPVKLDDETRRRAKREDREALRSQRGIDIWRITDVNLGPPLPKGWSLEGRTRDYINRREDGTLVVTLVHDSAPASRPTLKEREEAYLSQYRRVTYLAYFVQKLGWCTARTLHTGHERFVKSSRNFTYGRRYHLPDIKCPDPFPELNWVGPVPSKYEPAADKGDDPPPAPASTAKVGDLGLFDDDPSGGGGSAPPTTPSPEAKPPPAPAPDAASPPPDPPTDAKPPGEAATEADPAETMLERYERLRPPEPVCATYGAELEWGDISRDIVPPPELGWINPAEFHVVNTAPPYRGFATDPNGLDPPVGGEINTTVALSPLHLAEITQGLLDFYSAHGNPPATNPVGMLHIHAGVPGLLDDVDGIARIAQLAHDEDTNIERHLNIAPLGVDQHKKDKRISKLWGRGPVGIKMPQWMADHLRAAASVEDALERLNWKRGGPQRGSPLIRTLINLRTLKTLGTIEFRCFCSTVIPAQVLDAGIFCQRFVTKALVAPDLDLYAGLDNLPASHFDYELALAFLETTKEGQINPLTGKKYQEGRSGKLARIRQEPLNVERSETLGTPLSEFRRREPP